MKPREIIGRRALLIKLALGEVPRRGETQEAFDARIADDIARLARRITEDCAALRGAPQTAWIETPEPLTERAVSL